MDVILKEERHSEDADALRAYDQACADYYAERSRGARSSSWTQQIARRTSRPKREHMLAFLRRRGLATR